MLNAGNQLSPRSGSPLHVDPDRVFFTFASGRLGYDCVACNARCCRGHGYQCRSGPELDAQLRRQPAVRFFIDACDAASTHYHVKNSAPGCFFLDGSGRCRIHSSDGFDAKPTTCKLFPFNRAKRLGQWLIISPHLTLCPLVVQPRGRKSELSDHKQLLTLIESHGLEAHVPEAVSAEREHDRLVALEMGTVALAEFHHEGGRSYRSFVAAMLELCDQGCTAVPGSPRPATLRDIEQFSELLNGVLGAPGHAEMSPDLDRVLTAVTPTLRAELVLPTEVGSLCDFRRAPYLLLSLHRLLALARAAGMEVITYQTVMRFFREYRPLLELLSLINRPVRWRRDILIDMPRWHEPERSAYVSLAKALLPSRQRRARALLGTILCEHLPTDELTRVLFLKRLAPGLVKQLVEIDEFRGRERGWTPAGVQHWLIDRLEMPQLLPIINLASSRPRRGEPTYPQTRG